MAPEAPADTAGPSSPPPRLPEGWLPQWEGVRRKWYYVQRTTGKSQWEIPTEPIHLTPSTTPSIEGGPSQAPAHQPNDSTRSMESGNAMAGNYIAADSARISSSLDSQIHAQSENPLHGSGAPVWYDNQTGQQLPNGYEQQPANAGYVPNLSHAAAAQMNGAQAAFYANQAHSGFPHHLGQNVSPSAWGNNAGFQGQPGTYNLNRHQESLQGYPTGAAMHGHQPPASWTVTNNQQGEMTRGMVGGAGQPQWQAEMQAGHLNAAGDAGHTSALSQPFFGSYSSRQHAEQSSREFDRRPSNPSNPQEGSHYQQLQTFAGHSPQSMVDQARFQGYPVSRPLSQQPSADPALQGFSPLQHAQSQYQQQHLLRAQSGSDIPHAWSGNQGQQGSPQHHNPLAQIGTNQHIPQQQIAHGGPAGFPETAHVHQMPYLQSGNYPVQSSEQMARGASSQFVSGPWTSTPPSGPL